MGQTAYKKIIFEARKLKMLVGLAGLARLFRSEKIKNACGLAGLAPKKKLS
jgi:hypothetical protein